MKGRLLQVSSLSASQRDELFALFSQHFLEVRRDTFEADLEAKNWAVVLEDEHAQLKGFSSIQIYQMDYEGESLTVVYSGDTIMDPSAWSSSVLSRSWIAAVKHLKATYYPEGRCFWLLISSGFRTYRFLPTFWSEFFPRHDAPTPAPRKGLMDAISTHLFGTAYDAAGGVVRLPHPQVLRDELRGIPDERMKDEHVRFFDAMNPGHEAGDELVCLTEISEDNLTRAGRRMWFSAAAVDGV